MEKLNLLTGNEKKIINKICNKKMETINKGG